MFAVIIAPIFGTTGIQFFIRKQWLRGILCIAVTYTCYLVATNLKQDWPFLFPTGIALTSSILLYGEMHQLDFGQALAKAPTKLKVYWTIMLVVLIASVFLTPID